MISQDAILDYFKELKIIDLLIIISILLIIIIIVYRYYNVPSTAKKNKVKRDKDQKVRLALTCMTMKPVDFDIWLDYHFGLGIELIYLRIEETPELKEIINKRKEYKEGNLIATYFNNVDKTDNWWTKMDRQDDMCRKAIKVCEERGIDWILHCDDDELVYNPGDLIEYFDKVPSEYNGLAMETIEAVFPDIRNGSFRRTNKFVRCKTTPKCRSYYGVKSAARIMPGLVPFGPHQWNNTEGYNVWWENDMRILHFESSTFEGWKLKYKTMMVKDREIPEGFDFYHDSIAAVKSGDDKKMKDVYMKYLIKPYYEVQTEEINFLDKNI